MYLYFDNNGVLKEIINDEPSRQTGGNVIYCCWAGMPDATITGATIQYQLPDGTQSAVINYNAHYVPNATPSQSDSHCFIPYDENRDLKYFEYYKPYDFYKFNVDASLLTQVGMYLAMIRYTRATTPQVMQYAPFWVEQNRTGEIADGITAEQYNTLLASVGSRVAKAGDTMSGDLNMGNNDVASIDNIYVSHIYDNTTSGHNYTPEQVYTMLSNYTGAGASEYVKTLIGLATQSVNGLLSAVDKQRLDALYTSFTTVDGGTVDTLREVLNVLENYPTANRIITQFGELTASILSNTTRIGVLEQKSRKRLLYTASANPSANDISLFVTQQGYTSNLDSIEVVVNATKHIWHYYANELIHWKDDGVIATEKFSDVSLGTIKGSDANGKVHAENDGTGSVNGWSELVSDVASKQTQLSATQLDAVNSGIDVSKVGKIATNESAIADIEALIPSEATSGNQLADKNFVNSSIATQTALDGKVSKVDKDASIKQVGNHFSIEDDTITFTEKFYNLNTGTETTKSEVIPLADDENAGFMSPSDYLQIRSNTTRIGALEQRNYRLLYTAKANPTAQEIGQFVTDEGYTTNLEAINVIVSATKHIWHYYTGQVPPWVDDGLDNVEQFTNATAGVIKGSATNGKVYAENDGTGSVYGWDNLANAVAQNTTDIAGKQATLTQAQLSAVDSGITSAKVSTYDGYASGKQNALSQEQLDAVNSGLTSSDKTKLDGIEAGAEVNDVNSVDGQTGAVVLNDVKFVSQSLSSSEKLQAQQNIGVDEFGVEVEVL